MTHDWPDDQQQGRNMRRLPEYARGSRFSIENRTDTLFRVVWRQGVIRKVIADGVEIDAACAIVRQDAERCALVARWPTRRQRRRARAALQSTGGKEQKEETPTASADAGSHTSQK